MVGLQTKIVPYQICTCIPATRKNAPHPISTKSAHRPPDTLSLVVKMQTESYVKLALVLDHDRSRKVSQTKPVSRHGADTDAIPSSSKENLDGCNDELIVLFVVSCSRQGRMLLVYRKLSLS